MSRGGRGPEAIPRPGNSSSARANAVVIPVLIDSSEPGRLANGATGSMWKTTWVAMAIGVRVEPELERRLDQLALSLGKSRSTCVREAIALYVDRFSGGEEAMRQSQVVTVASPGAYSGKPRPAVCDAMSVDEHPDRGPTRAALRAANAE